MKRQTIFAILVIVALLAIDQLTKYLVATTMELGEQIVVIPNFITLTSHRNTGAAWGILDGNMTFFYIITVFAAGLFVYLLKDVDMSEKRLYSAGVILMIAGGFGNFIDRLLFQEVVDFLDVDLWSYTTFPIFNVADICLVVGMIAFATDIVLEDVIKWKKPSA